MAFNIYKSLGDVCFKVCKDFRGCELRNVIFMLGISFKRTFPGMQNLNFYMGRCKIFMYTLRHILMISVYFEFTTMKVPFLINHVFPLHYHIYFFMFIFNFLIK